MNMARVLAAICATAVFALPVTASAQWSPSPTIIIVNPSPAVGYGGWGPGVAPAAWSGGCGWGGGCGGAWMPVGVAVPASGRRGGGGADVGLTERTRREDQFLASFGAATPATTQNSPQSAAPGLGLLQAATRPTG
jgi:hypothetical protein